VYDTNSEDAPGKKLPAHAIGEGRKSILARNSLRMTLLVLTLLARNCRRTPYADGEGTSGKGAASACNRQAASSTSAFIVR